MKKLILVSFIFFSHITFANPFWQYMAKLPIVGKHIPTVPKDQVAKLENLNELTIIPTTSCPEKRIRTIDQVCTAIQDGNIKTNNRKCTDGPN